MKEPEGRKAGGQEGRLLSLITPPLPLRERVEFVNELCEFTNSGEGESVEGLKG